MPIDIDVAKNLCSSYNRSILSCNIQSYNQNHDSIKELISELKPSIISLNEIWNPKISMNLPNYHPPLKFIRSNRRGGGVAIILKDFLVYEVFDPIDRLECEYLEKIAVKITDPNYKTFLLISIYRPPGNNFRCCLNDLKEIFNAACLSNLPIIITGDINIDMLKNDNLTNDILKKLPEFQLKSVF